MYSILIVLALVLLAFIITLSRRSFNIEQFVLNDEYTEDHRVAKKKRQLALVEIIPGVLPAICFGRVKTYRWAYSQWGTLWYWVEENGSNMPARLNDLLADRWQQEQLLAHDTQPKA